MELHVAAPEFSYVLQRIGALGRYPESIAHADEAGELVRSYPRREALERENYLIREFVNVIGWDQAVAGSSGGNEEARLREKWRAFVERAEREILLRGIPSGGLRELKRIEAGAPKQIGGAVKALIEAGE